MTIIAKYSDYVIQTIEYFVSAIKAELDLRDLKGLFNGQIEDINVSKQHPIVTMMANRLSGRETERSGIVPAIAVTPGSPEPIGFTLGQGYKEEIVNDDFIDILKAFYVMTDKNIQKELLITKTQIDAIVLAYNKAKEGEIKCQSHEWRRNEEVNISVWSESPDVDILLGNLTDSIVAGFQVGFAGDDSKLKNLSYKVTKGLTNFNFGRVLFGSEYSLTFLNTYNNYTIYSENYITDFETNFTSIVSGESE